MAAVAGTESNTSVGGTWSVSGLLNTIGDAAGLPEESLLSELRAAEHAARVARARQVELIAEIEDRRVTSAARGMRAPEWFALTTGCHGGEARSFVQCARTLLGWLPGTFAALAEGRISWRKAEVLAREVTERNAAEVAAIESVLLAEDGPGVTFEAWRVDVRERVRRIDAELDRAARAAAARAAAESGGAPGDPAAPAAPLDGADPAAPVDGAGGGVAEGAADRHAGDLGDGRSVADGRSDAAGSPGAAELFEQPGPPPDELFLRTRADGSVEITARFFGAGAAIVAEQLEAGAQRAWYRHRHDAVRLGEVHGVPVRSCLLAEAFLEMCTANAGALGTPLVTLRMQAADPGVGFTATGQTLTGAELDLVLGADSRFRPLVERSGAVPLWFGSEVRWATPEMREAGMVRDGGCVFPSCTAPPRWVSMHHTFPHGLGGPTSIEYTASLCDHHHRSVIHRRGWVMWPEFDSDGLPTGLFIIQTARGERMYSQQHGRQPDRPPPEGPPPWWVGRVRSA